MVNSPARRNLSPKEISASGELKTGVVREVEEAPETEEEEEEDAQEEGDEGDEEEDEIEQIIRRSSHFLMDDRTANGGSRRTLPHSCSAHANLNMFKRQERTGLAQHKLEEQTEEGETEDSDEELFAEHSALLPLRKSKSAFAGFHCERIQQSTAPFECPVVVKGTTSAVPEEHQEGNDNQIAELIDLRRGDVLKFRIAHSRSSKGASSSSSSSVSLSVGANERAVSRWSAPACPAGDSEVEWDSEEEHGGEGTEQFWETGELEGDGYCLSTKDRKGSSWSAPSQFWDKLAKQRDKEERKRIREAEEQAHWEGREMDEQGEEGAEKEEEEEEEGPYYAGLEPQNMRNLEIEEAQPEGEEGMSTSEDDEEDREDEEQNGKDEGEEEHIVVSDLRKHMRVFVSANSHYPAILHRHGAQLPSSRSDSQLLWRRSAAPPPPAPFPLETEKQRAIPHSRTYGGGMGARGDEEEEQEEEEGGEEAAEDKMSQEEQSMSGGLRTEVSRPLQQIVIRPRFRRRHFPGMGNRHSDTSFDRPTRIHLLDGQQDEIPMADDCPSPNPLLGPGLLTLPLRRGAKYAAEAALENSPLSSSYYSEEEGDGSGKREGARRAVPRRPRIAMQRSAAARLCRRGSPPFAQTELLSESEISDLEEQIASGRLVNGASEEGTLRQFLEDGGSREREQEHRDGGETGDGQSVEGDGEGRKQDPPEEAEGTLGKSASICGSCSMPTIHCAPAGGGGYWGSGHAPANFWQSEYPAEDEPWEEHLSGANMHRSLTMQGEMEGQLRGGRRRRMLPLRPDQQPRTSAQEAPGAEQSSECLSPPSEPLLSQSFSAKRRQLPKIPSGEGPLDSIDIASTTKEYLLSVLHRGGGPQQQRRRESGSQMDEQPLEVEEDFSPSGPVLPSPSVVQRPALALAAAFVGPRWGNAAQHQSSSEEYKFSYGLDQSVLRHARKGLSMEDSYYEDVDGLNGNLVGLYDGGARERARGWDREDELYTPDDETERRKVSAYNLADGAKSSSGISSCCTTSSRSCEPAEGHSYQQLLVRRQRQRADALANDPSAPTHRAQFPFMPRHADEMALERGDALHVGEKYEDHWCFGTNLRTGQRGIFPEAHIVEIDLVEEICRSVLPDSVPHQAKQERDTFYLTMLASIEVAHHKGNDVLVQAINKVCSVYQQKEEILVPQTVLMEISFRGIHVIDKRKKDIFRCPTFDYFYSLQNIAFCGAHPKELRYFGFITKHPLLPRFACHVFLSNESTQPIVEAIGRAFKRSYDEYMAFAHPTEDIFID